MPVCVLLPKVGVVFYGLAILLCIWPRTIRLKACGLATFLRCGASSLAWASSPLLAGVGALSLAVLLYVCP